VLAVTGKPQQAVAEADRAATLAAAAAGKQNDAVALALWAKARGLEMQGKLDLAHAALEQAIAIDDKVLGHDNPADIDIFTAMGRVQVERKQAADAIQWLERALAMSDKANLHGKWRARAKFTLARALWQAGQHDRALALAKEANEWYAPSSATRERGELAAWLKKPS
jgi:tetratricopeptide (TPR) repeat protein